MAVPLILCRLKEDHSVVQEIGKTALIHFPDWEPVPDEQRAELEELSRMRGPLPAGSEQSPEPEPDPAAGSKSESEPGSDDPATEKPKRPTRAKKVANAAKDEE